MNEEALAVWNDVRDETVASRRTIGFDGLRERWAQASAIFERERLTICGHPVMEAWEDGYMKTLAGIAGSRGGRVLEIGFGLGLSARYLQTHPLSEHVLIEANAEVFHAAERFATRALRPTRVLQGFWEEVAPTLPCRSFDGILFDTYPLAAHEVHRNHFPFFQEAARLLAQDGVFTYYSDEIDAFAPAHEAALRAAGFTRLDGHVCRLDLPETCAYWKAETLLAPIIRL